MPCKIVDLEGGGRAIVCSRSKSRKKCWKCDRPALKLCDWPIGKGKTCDRPLCILHTHSKLPDLDYCDEHVGKIA